jgi:hypothetical protein
MKTLARLASALIAVSSFVFPLAAMAETKAPAGRHDHHTGDAFPMKAEVFQKLVNGKIDRMKGHFDHGLEKRSLSAAQKTEIEKSMGDAMKELHAAVDKVAADGTVTKDEAKQVKELSDQLRTKMRSELKGKHANSKAKGAKSSKGKSGNKGKAPAKKAEKAEKPEAPAKDK